MTSGPFAHFAGTLATDLVEVVDVLERPGCLDRGWWAVVGTFEGAITGYRFGRVRQAPPTAGPPGSRVWPGVTGWEDSLPRNEFLLAVGRIRDLIAAGMVYQANLCRLLTAPLPPGADPVALADRLAAGNPAPYQGILHTGSDWIVTASPELFLARDGRIITSGPVKGTAAPGQPFAAKDYPENIMITDLVRNDLGRIATAGSVTVTALAAGQDHPGLRHLVSIIRAELASGAGWGELLAATMPPGSVSGAPKYTALQTISELEPVPRGPYCGAIGFVDGDRERARLAVGIRTFHTTRNATLLHFGAGAGITYGSVAADEWAETELKSATLLGLAGSPHRVD